MMNRDYDAAEDWVSRRYLQLEDIANEFCDRYEAGEREFIISWPRVRAAPLKRIWLAFGKIGFLHARQEKLLAGIADRMLTLIARLHASTALCGHTETCGRKELDPDTQERLTDEMWEHMLWYALEDAEGNWLLSDYAWKHLRPLYGELFRAEGDPPRQIYTIDRILNVVHQRSDLASYFIEGGSKTLLEIFNQGGYSPDHDA